MSTANCRCTGVKSVPPNPDPPKQPPCPCKKCKAKAEELNSESWHPCKKPEDYGSEDDAGAAGVGPLPYGNEGGQGPAKCACARAQAQTNGWPETGQGVNPDNIDGYWPETWNQGAEDDYWPDDRQNAAYSDDWPNDGDKGRQADWPEYYPEEEVYQEKQIDWPEHDGNEQNNDYWPETGQQAHDDFPQDFGRSPDCRDFFRKPPQQKCECPATKLHPLGAKGLVFGPSEYGRKSSMTEGIPRIDEQDQPLPRSACSVNYVPNTFEDMMSGRDTLNLPIHLRGNNGLLNISGQMICQEHSKCNEYCSINTDCSPDCFKGGKASIQLSTNENINMLITFLLEMLGILVFFAICTFTFWITVCYYVIQVVIDLVNAGRNVHVAVAIMFTLLIIAYSITHLTYGAASCFQDKAIRLNGGCSCRDSAGEGSSTSAALSSLKKSLANMIGKRNCSQANAKAPVTIHGKSSSQRHSKASKHKYTDCQGRKIFQRSRRNAMLTEMKQPPTWILWIRETVYGIFGQS